MNVRYDGPYPVTVPSLSAVARQPIEPGDVVAVPDDFSHPHFVEVDDEVTNARDIVAEQVADAEAIAASRAEAQDEAAPAAQDAPPAQDEETV